MDVQSNTPHPDATTPVDGWCSEQRLRFLFEHAPLGILELDLSAGAPQICAANRTAESAFGWPAAELPGLPLAVVFAEASHDQLPRLIETALTGKTAALEIDARRRDGATFRVRCLAAAHEDQDGRRIIVTVEDITAEQQRCSEAEAIDEERRRIAHEIHDGVAQDLAALRLKLALWRDWVVADPGRMRAELDLAQAMLDVAIEDMRRAIYALRPLALAEVGLLPALRRHVAEFNEQHKTCVDLHIDLAETRLPAELELPLFRVVQEGLNNVVRHARASHAWVRLEPEDDNKVVLKIRDNGQGFDVAALDRAGRRGHLGLLQMRERVEQEGGQLRLSSAPGQGTELCVTLPL
jgi:PAS domain S-box-containing protein